MLSPGMDENEGRRSLLHSGGGGDAAGGGGMLQDFITEFSKQRTIVVTRLQTMRDPSCSSWQEEARTAEKALEEMESTRRQVQVQLRLELSGTAGSEKQQWDSRLQDWSKEAASLRGELASVREEQGRRALLGTGLQASQRSSAMQSTDLLAQSSKRLEECKMQALETEEISQGILSDLHSQRETILHMRGNMGIVSSELSSAAGTLNRLIRGAERKKLLTYLVAFMLSLGLTVWALSTFGGLSLSATIGVAVVIVFLTAVAVVVRQRLKGRANGLVGP